VADQGSAIIVTTSSKKERLESYLDVGDIELTEDDVKSIDDAGAKKELWMEKKGKMVKYAKVGVTVVLGMYAAARLVM
jgi:diketogulonate reductase-like aldo/keto reductase